MIQLIVIVFLLPLVTLISLVLVIRRVLSKEKKPWIALLIVFVLLAALTAFLILMLSSGLAIGLG